MDPDIENPFFIHIAPEKDPGATKSHPGDKGDDKRDIGIIPATVQRPKPAPAPPPEPPKKQS